jgi:hypothetical protein
MDSKRDNNTSAVGCVEEAGSRSCVVQQRKNLPISIYYMRERGYRDSYLALQESYIIVCLASREAALAVELHFSTVQM